MLRVDPRVYQVAVLASLLAVGLFRLDFDVSGPQVIVTVGAALLTQAAAARLARLPSVGYSSALISSLSLCLLLRTTDLRLAAVAPIVAIGSKFVLRLGGKHVFNPTALALVILLAASDRAWVSPGQWGETVLFAFLLACLGTVVTTRASRADVSFAFLACYAGLLAARALWLGDPMPIPFHRLQSGALLLFTFFMISDPKTTPDSRAGRVIFAAAVALGAWYVHFVLFRTNGLLWSLAACAPLVPVIDRLLPGPRYAWPGAAHEENRDETLDAAVARHRPRAVVQ